MNKLLLALIIVAPMLLATGCVTESVYYTPAYTTRYTNVGYYGGPYWSDAYYYGYDDIGNVGYWGMYDSYNVY